MAVIQLVKPYSFEKKNINCKYKITKISIDH